MSQPPDSDVEPPDGGGTLPDDIQAQLRSAAKSLAPLFGGDVLLAEQAMFESALELTQDATVLRYATVLATRRARRRRLEAEEQG